MTRDETVELFLECEAERDTARAAAFAAGKDRDEAEKIAHDAARAHWNAWAGSLLAEAKARHRNAHRVDKGEPLDSLERDNEDVENWLQKAAADFSRCLFLPRGNTATPAEEVNEKGRLADNPVMRTIELGEQGFHGFDFPGLADFRGATFSCDASFHSAHFSGGADFRDAKFEGCASFHGTSFSGNADFENAIFHSCSSFREAMFQCKAEFSGIKVERAFYMQCAKFAKVPSFSQADFKQAPDLDGVGFPLPNFWCSGELDLVPHYRAIRRIAIQGADFGREQMAFKGEVRSKRGSEHKPWDLLYWVGLTYDAFSDYGRSIARPLVIGFLLVYSFAGIHLLNAGVPFSEWSSVCPTSGAPKAAKAITFSFGNSLPPFIGASRSDLAKEFFGQCLAMPGAPEWSSTLQIVQATYGAVLTFMLLLGLRNQFKIK